MSHHSNAAAHNSADHGTVKSYIVGFILSIILTMGSFGLFMVDGVPRNWQFPGLLILCVIQIFVQLVFFLHMGTASSQRSNMAAFLFAVLIMGIVVVGSLWVLTNMNANMMPPMPGA
jgi:cytochrome o ubiquinol oxidase operon protein cyoD